MLCFRMTALKMWGIKRYHVNEKQETVTLRLVQRTISVRQDYNCLNTTQHKLNYVVSISKAVRPCGVGLWWEGKRKGKCCQHNSEWFPAVARHGVDYRASRQWEGADHYYPRRIILSCMQRSLTAEAWQTSSTGSTTAPTVTVCTADKTTATLRQL